MNLTATKPSRQHKNHWGFFSLLQVSVLCISIGWAEETQIPANPSTPPSIQRQTLYSGSVKAKKSDRKRKISRKTSYSKSNAKNSRPTVAARLESVRQNVEIQSSETENWKKAQDKTALKTSDKIRTGKQSMARIKLEDGTKVLLLQNSQAEIENMSSLQRTIKLVRGRVRAIVSRMGGGKSFAIKTPIGVASVRGTEFEVEFSEDGQDMQIDVFAGQVGVSKLGDLANEVLVNPGESLKFGAEGDIGDPIKAGAAPLDQQEVQAEFYDSKVKDAVVAQAAEDLRNADYQTGKSLIDVDGARVRVEEYISRPAPNQFKLVSLNERETRFDYFTYTGTFNQTLPEDLSIALRQVGGKLGSTAPDYYLTDYEMLMSNTKDNITDTGSGGHLVKIDFDGTDYTLSEDPNASDYDATNTRTIPAAQLQADGTYKIYNPLKDAFSLVSAADKDEAVKMSVLEEGVYRDLGASDTLWKTRFDDSSYNINNITKTAFGVKSGTNHTLAIDLDATFTEAPVTTISEYPEGSGTLHNRLTLFYSDGSKTVYDNYIIDDDGNVAPRSAFSGLTASADFQNELLNWNYQQKVTSTEMSDEINLVIDPRIGTISGLIQ